MATIAVVQPGEFTAEDRETIAVALGSYADWLTKQRQQAARDMRRFIRWSESDRMGTAARESYVKQAADISRYLLARDRRIEEVRALIDRVKP